MLQSLRGEALLFFVPGFEMNPTEGKKKRLQSQVPIKQSIHTKSR